MRALFLSALTILGLSSTAFADPTLIMNCVYPTDQYQLLQALKTVLKPNRPQSGVPEADLVTATKDARRAMDQGSMVPFRKDQFVSILNPKIVSVEGRDDDANVAQVCFVMEGELVTRESKLDPADLK